MARSTNIPARLVGEGEGVGIDDQAEIATPQQAAQWLVAWESIGGSVTISADGRTLHPWVMFTADRYAPGIAAHLMGEMLDTPGLPRAIRAVITQRLRR